MRVRSCFFWNEDSAGVRAEVVVVAVVVVVNKT